MSLLFNPTLFIVIITVLVSLAAWQSQALMARLIFYPPAIARGQVDRFVTHGFIHADTMHLLFNMITLFSFGQAVQRIFNAHLGGLGFILFYLVALVVASVPSYLQHKDDRRYSSLGASGAVMAVVFSYILFDPWTRIYFFIIPMPAIVFALLYVGYSIWAHDRGGSSVNHSAHLVGGMFGVVATILIEPHVVGQFAYQMTNPRF